jgi:hypothetical protein
VEGIMKIKLRMPLDSTFLSQIFYEGVLYILNCVPESSFTFDEARLLDDSLCRAYENVADAKVEEISIVLTGNDKVEKFFASLNIAETLPKKTYREVLKILKNSYKNIPITKDVVVLQAEMKGRNVFLDLPERCSLAAPQLFKVDRYTGFSTLEMNTTSQQLGLRASPIAILIGLLGVYSSHIITVRTLESVYHYFLFFSPDEITPLLASGDRNRLLILYGIKEALRELLSRVLRGSVMSEVLVLEVLLNAEIRSKLAIENLDKVGFNLFRISPEGMTYKIYETVPLSLYKDPLFYYIISKRGVEADKLCEKLQGALSPDGVIMEALRSFTSRNKYGEADVILRGVFDLYRFVTLADISRLYGFLRSLEEAHRILTSTSQRNARAQRRAEKYAEIQREISYAL